VRIGFRTVRSRTPRRRSRPLHQDQNDPPNTARPLFIHCRSGWMECRQDLVDDRAARRVEQLGLGSPAIQT